MGVTALDVGRNVRWTEHSHTYRGVLHSVPEPGSHRWYRTAGRCEIRLHGGGYVYAQRADLELDQEAAGA